MTPRQQQDRFASLVDEHKKIVYKICFAYCAAESDRDDLAQEILVQLWRSFPSFDERQRFSTWMYRVALNVAISFYRREHRRASKLDSRGEPVLETLPGGGTPSAEIVMVRDFIERLDPLNRALALLYLDGNSYREIGDVLGISETNAGTKIARLKQQMRRAFDAPDKD